MFSYRVDYLLPFCFGAAFGLGFAAYGYSGYYIEQAIGYPSSTAGLIFIFIPIYSVAISGGGFLVGCLLQFLLPSALKQRRISIVVLLLFTLSAMCFGSSLAYLSVKSSVEQVKPKVIFSSKWIHKSLVQTTSLPKKTFDKNVAGNLLTNSTTWNGKKVQITFTQDGALTFILPTLFYQEDLRPFDYAVGILPIPVKLFSKEKEYLAVLLALRASSHRLLLVIFAPDGAKVYQELLKTDLYLHSRMGTVNIGNGNQQSLQLYNGETTFSFTGIE